MSTGRKGVRIRGEEPRIVSVPSPRTRQINHRQWTHLVDEYLPQMWAELSADGAPLDLRHEACVLAWLRLTQREEITAGEETGAWLAMTARIELDRALARHEMGTQHPVRGPHEDRGATP